MLLVRIVTGIAMVARLAAQTPDQSAESSARAVAEAWQKAWNTHDMNALAEVVDERVDFITVGGRWLRGREAFKEHHALLHTTVSFNESTTELRATHARRLSPDVLLAHAEWAFRGDRNPDGAARRPRDTIMTWVLTQSGGRWRIRASQNTNVTEAVRFGTGIATAAVLPVQTPDQSAESSARAVAEAWQKALNSGDMDALAELVDERVDFITVGGRWLSGRQAFKEHYTRLRTTVSGNEPPVEIRATHAQRLSPNVLLVHAEWSATGDPDGTARQPRDTIMTWVLTQSGGRWRIRASQTTNVTITLLPPPR